MRALLLRHSQQECQRVEADVDGELFPTKDRSVSDADGDGDQGPSQLSQVKW
jgi:hypothetical protein